MNGSTTERVMNDAPAMRGDLERRLRHPVPVIHLRPSLSANVIIGVDTRDMEGHSEALFAPSDWISFSFA